MPLQLEPGRYLGETRGHQVVAGLIVTETLHRFPSQLPLHTHIAPYFCLVLSGAFDERVGATLCEARPGDLLFHPPGETHTDEIRAARTLVFNIVLAGSWVGLLGQLEPCRWPRPGRQNASVARVAGRIAHELAAYDSISDFAIQGLVHTLLAEADHSRASSRGGPPRWLPASAGVHPRTLPQRLRSRGARSRRGSSCDSPGARLSRAHGLYGDRLHPPTSHRMGARTGRAQRRPPRRCGTRRGFRRPGALHARVPP